MHPFAPEVTTVDTRELKALEIAARTKITFDGHAWTVPSQAGNGPHRVVLTANTAACTCDVVLAIGTSALVYPAAGLPAIAQRHGAWFAEINPQSTPLTPTADLVIARTAGSCVPALLDAWEHA